MELGSSPTDLEIVEVPPGKPLSGWLTAVNAVLSRFQNPRSLKAALHCMGLPAGELRKPYLALEEHEVTEIRAVLLELGVL